MESFSDKIRQSLGFGKKSSRSNPQSTPLVTLASEIPISQRYRMILDAVSAIEYLHSKGYMHCDIKSLNYLVADVSIYPLHSLEI